MGSWKSCASSTRRAAPSSGDLLRAGLGALRAGCAPSPFGLLGAARRVAAILARPAPWRRDLPVGSPPGPLVSYGGLARSRSQSPGPPSLRPAKLGYARPQRRRSTTRFNGTTDRCSPREAKRTISAARPPRPAKRSARSPPPGPLAPRSEAHDLRRPAPSPREAKRTISAARPPRPAKRSARSPPPGPLAPRSEAHDLRRPAPSPREAKRSGERVGVRGYRSPEKYLGMGEPRGHFMGEAICSLARPVPRPRSGHTASPASARERPPAKRAGEGPARKERRFLTRRAARPGLSPRGHFLGDEHCYS